jgi:hypothetical protein
MTGWRVCRPVNSNMGMICGAFKRLWNPRPIVIPHRQDANRYG